MPLIVDWLTCIALAARVTFFSASSTSSDASKFRSKFCMCIGLKRNRAVAAARAGATIGTADRSSWKIRFVNAKTWCQLPR